MAQDTALLTLDTDARRDAPGSAFLAIGGAGAVSAVVDEFYARVLADAELAGFFEPLLAADGLPALKRHQILLLSKVLGGPDRYTGRDLQAAHARLNVTEDAFRRVSLYLLTVMHDFKVPMDILKAVDDVLRSVEPLIVSAGPESSGADR